MNHYAEVGQLGALLVIVAGLLTCFWGYRILKVSLAIVGFIAGAFGGWELGLSLANSSTGVALGCALLGGMVGIVLCLWVYFLGIFFLGPAIAKAVVKSEIKPGTCSRTVGLLTRTSFVYRCV
jgi:uncharacterized protein DUF4203